MKKKIQGSIVKTGIVVMEKLDIKLDIHATEANIGKLDPKEMLIMLLEQEGSIPVNSLKCNVDDLMQRLGPDGHYSAQCYHVVYPAAEASNTICMHTAQ